MHRSTTALLAFTLALAPASLLSHRVHASELWAAASELGACGEPAMPIHQIQGAGGSTPLERGTPVVVERGADGGVRAFAGEDRDEIPVTRAFWFAWSSFYPNTQVVD